MISKPKSLNWEVVFLFTLLASLFPLFFGLGSIGLFEPEETRLAQMAREMLEKGDWLIPRLRGIPILEKPPLATWITARSFQFFGQNEFAARLLPLLSALTIVFFTFRLGCLLGGLRLGLMGAAILVSAPFFWGMGRILSTDTLFTAATTAGLYFLFALRVQRSNWTALGLGIAAAAAALSKGPVGLVLLLLGIFSFILIDRSWRPLRRLLHPLAISVFLILAAPWFVLVSRKYPSYLDYFFVQQHLGRFFGLDLELKDFHAEPIYYFIPVLLVGFFPYFFFLPNAIRSAWRSVSSLFDHKNCRALWIWGILVFLFFSLGSGKRVPYIFPLWPVLAIGLAVFWREKAGGSPREAKTFFWSFLPFGLLIPAGFFLWTHPSVDAYSRNLKDLFPWILAMFSLGYVGILVFLRRGKILLALIAAIFWMASLHVFSVEGLRRLESHFSMKEIAKKAGELTGQDAVLISFPRYRPGLSFYSGREVMILGISHELEYGLGLEGCDTSPIIDPQFGSLLNRPGSFVLVGSTRHIERNINRWDPKRKIQRVGEVGKWMVIKN